MPAHMARDHVGGPELAADVVLLGGRLAARADGLVHKGFGRVAMVDHSSDRVDEREPSDAIGGKAAEVVGIGGAERVADNDGIVDAVRVEHRLDLLRELGGLGRHAWINPLTRLRHLHSNDEAIRCVVCLAGEDTVDFWGRHGYAAEHVTLRPEWWAMLADPFGGSHMVAKWF